MADRGFSVALPPPLTEKLPYSCGRGDTPRPETSGQSDDGGMTEFLAHGNLSKIFEIRLQRRSLDYRILSMPLYRLQIYGK